MKVKSKGCRKLFIYINPIIYDFLKWMGICTILKLWRKKRPMGHIVHLRNILQAIHKLEQVSDKTSRLVKSHIYLSMKNSRALNLTKLNPLHLRMHCVKFGWNGPLVQEKKFICNQCTFTLLLLSPLGKEHGLSFKKLNPLYPRMLCAKFGQNWPCSSGVEDENVKNLQIKLDRTAQLWWSKQNTLMSLGLI